MLAWACFSHLCRLGLGPSGQVIALDLALIDGAEKNALVSQIAIKPHIRRKLLRNSGRNRERIIQERLATLALAVPKRPDLICLLINHIVPFRFLFVC